MRGGRLSPAPLTAHLALLALVVLVLLPTARTIASGPSLAYVDPSDTLSYNVPLLDHLRHEARAGRLFPLWRSTQFYGEALAPDPQNRVFYPPMLLYAALDMPLAHNLYLAFHEVVLALGMWVLLRGQGRSPLAALAGAAMVALSLKTAGYVMAGWDTVFGAVAWVPLALHFFERSLRSRALAPRAGLGVALALSILAGTPFFAAYLGLALPVLGAARCGDWRGGGRGRPRARRLATALGAGFGLGLALAAPVLLATLETSRRSARADVGHVYGTAASDLLGALARPDFSHANLWWEGSNHQGVLLLPLVLAGLARRGRRAGVLLVVVFSVLALGPTTPVGLAVERIPVLGTLSYPSRLLWVAAIGLAVLAARGVDVLLAGRTRPSARAVAFALALGAVVECLALARGVSADARWMLLLGLGPLGVAPFLAFLGTRARRGAVAVAVLATLLELLAVTEEALVRVPWASLRPASPLAAALAGEPFARVAAVGSDCWVDPMLPPLALEGVDRADGYNPLHARAVADFLGAIAGGPAPRWAPVRWIASVERPDLLAVGVTHVYTRQPLAGFETVAEQTTPLKIVVREDRSAAWRHLVIDFPVALQRVKDALPRAFLAPRARPVAAEEQLSAMVSARPFSGRRQLVVSGPVSAERTGEARIEPVLVVERTPGHVRLRTLPDASGGWVTWLEAWSPDWSATVDGVPAPIEHADALFRAVLVEPGSHDVVLELGLPASCRVGGDVALLAVVVLAGYALSRRGSPGRALRGRSPPGRPPAAA